LIPFAFIFLFEPFFMLSDLLPDVIGYLILYCGLVSLSDINHKIRNALGKFKLAIIVSTARFVAKYLLESIFPESEASMGLLIFIFVLSFFELILLIPAYKNLFEGLLSLALMHNGESVYFKKCRKILKTDRTSGEKVLIIRESSKNATEKICSLTVFFCVIKEVLVLIPELTTLTTNQSYEFIRIVRLLAFFIALPIGILWLIKSVTYFVSVYKDKPFVDNLTELRRRELLNNPIIYDARVISTGLYMLIAAFALSIDIYSDHVNVIQNCIFYAVVIFAAVVMSKFSKKWCWLAGISGVGAFISYFAHQFNETLYSDPNFYAGAAKKNVEAYYSFYKMAFFSLADAIWMLITVVIAVIFVLDIYKGFSRYPLCESKKEKKEFMSGFLIYAITSLVFAFLSCSSYIYFIFTQPNEGLGLWYFSYASLINVGVSIAFSISAIALVFFAKGRIESRYSLDL
jgi:hypothetical protein